MTQERIMFVDQARICNLGKIMFVDHAKICNSGKDLVHRSG